MNQPNAPNPNPPQAAAGAQADPRVEAARALATEIHEGTASAHHGPPAGVAASPLGDFAFGVVLDKLKGVGVEELQNFLLYVQSRIAARMGGA
jgi:hypothetical protein